MLEIDSNFELFVEWNQVHLVVVLAQVSVSLLKKQFPLDPSLDMVLKELRREKKQNINLQNWILSLEKISIKRIPKDHTSEAFE